MPRRPRHNIRIARGRLLQGKEYRGKNTSKREYFYGCKVGLLTNEQGLPVELARIGNPIYTRKL